MTAIDAEMAKFHAVNAAIPSQLAFSDIAQMQSTLEVILPTYESRVNSWLPGIPISSERVALISLSYNGGLGPNLNSAIVDNNRAEAWYEIRYDTNGNNLNGIAKRRYYESELFGLYNNSSNLTDADAVQVGQMYAAHQPTIEAYEAQYGSQVAAANRDYTGASVETLAQSFQPAILFLENEYHLTFGNAAMNNGLQRLIVDYPTATGAYTNNLTGTDNTNDMIIGMGGGNEVITGTKGNDLIEGGTGTNTLDFSAYSSELDVTSGVNGSGRSYIVVDSLLSVTNSVAYDMEKLKLGDGNNNINMTLTNASVLQEIDVGNGDNTINITGGAPLNIYLGTGDNTVTNAPANSTVTLANGDTTTIDSSDKISLGSSDNIIVVSGPQDPVSDVFYASSGADLTTDTLTFEGNSIAGQVPADTVDQYGRTFMQTGSTLTVTGATGGDALTINDFQNGDFGVNFPKGDPDPTDPGNPGDPKNKNRSDSSAMQETSSQNNTSMTDPIVFDMSGSGIALTPLAQSTAYFDLHGTGVAEHTGWIGPTTGLLVNSPDPTGIDNLFGNSSVDGFTALQTLAGSGNSVINSSTSGWNSLYVWQDATGNGVAANDNVLMNEIAQRMKLYGCF